jgi:hypothetical protein
MRASALLAAAGLAAAPLAAGAQSVLGAGAAALESRVDAAERAVDRWLDAAGTAGDVARRFHVGGYASGVFLDAEDDAQLGPERHQLWDARLFLDVDLARELDLGGRTWLRSAGASVEWNLYRLGRREDELGDLYVELQGIGDSSWLSLQAGRFQIPVGENYLRFGKGAKDTPFVTNAVGGPWWWDEGVKLYGSESGGRYGYVASFTNGETPRDFGTDAGDQYTLKLFVKPRPWLHLSASALYSGRTGSEEAPGSAALWLGEAWGRGFGAGSPVPNYVDGRETPDAPGGISHTLYLGADAILTHPAGVRLWLSYGSYDVAAAGGGPYDRRLHGWIAELVIEGRLASPELRPLYLALRANGLGTYDRERGYLLDVRYAGALGYDMRALDEYAVVLGWRVGRFVTLKAQYSAQRASLVRGAGALRDAADDADFFAAAVEVHF